MNRQGIEIAPLAAVDRYGFASEETTLVRIPMAPLYLDLGRLNTRLQGIDRSQEFVLKNPEFPHEINVPNKKRNSFLLHK
jgi:hypothetical protein